MEIAKIFEYPGGISRSNIEINRNTDTYMCVDLYVFKKIISQFVLIDRSIFFDSVYMSYFLCKYQNFVSFLIIYLDVDSALKRLPFLADCICPVFWKTSFTPASTGDVVLKHIQKQGLYGVFLVLICCPTSNNNEAGINLLIVANKSF